MCPLWSCMYSEAVRGVRPSQGASLQDGGKRSGGAVLGREQTPLTAGASLQGRVLTALNPHGDRRRVVPTDLPLQDAPEAVTPVVPQGPLTFLPFLRSSLKSS